MFRLVTRGVGADRKLWKLYYDGSCNLCHASSKKIKKWAPAAGQPLEVHTLQSPDAQAKGYNEQMVLEADKVYFAGDAWLRVMAIAPWYLRWISWMRFTGVTAWLAKGLYNLVARTRHYWLGRRNPGIAPCAGNGG
jgi:predicted DCC family thiol-disulfide oxidoreductase YuxK